MDVKVNAASIQKALNDERYKTEMIEFLNSIVDEELEKGDRMDTDLVTDCTEMIFELENGYEELNIERETADKIIKFCHKKTKTNRNVNKRMVALFAAVLIITSTLSVTVFADEIKSLIEWIQQELSIDEDAKREHYEITNITVLYNGDMSAVKSEADIDYNAFTVIGYDNSGNEYTLDISDCDRKVARTVKDGKTYISVVVTYDKAPGYGISFPIEQTATQPKGE